MMSRSKALLPFLRGKGEVGGGMSNAFASALELSPKIIREHLADPAMARRLITEGLQGTDFSDIRGPKESVHLVNRQEGFEATRRWYVRHCGEGRKIN
jgi:hypothetical protein